MAKSKIFLFATGIMITLVFALMAVNVYRHFRVIRNFPVTAWSEDHRADCGVVLTGGPNRVDDALESLYLSRIKKLIISGVHPSAQLRDIFPQLPYMGQLDPGDIILEKRSLTTYGNAQQALPLVEALNCKDVVLITSKLHMHRAYQTFKVHFPKEIPIYQRSTVGKREASHWIRVWVETLKTAFYDLWFF